MPLYLTMLRLVAEFLPAVKIDTRHHVNIPRQIHENSLSSIQTTCMLPFSLEIWVVSQLIWNQNHGQMCLVFVVRRLGRTVIVHTSDTVLLESIVHSNILMIKE